MKSTKIRMRADLSYIKQQMVFLFSNGIEPLILPTLSFND